MPAQIPEINMDEMFTKARFLRWWRLLTFRATTEDFENLGRKDLALGLIAAWIVGMGRYWDDPKATLLQHLGLGSVVYVFVLSALLWLITKPVVPSMVSYLKTLTFVSMTSPPAIFYAIPVELWMSLKSANQINLVFLCAVALWRVILLFQFLRRGVGQSVGESMTCGLMPLAIIFTGLVYLNLHHVVFQIMGGIRDADQTSQDAAYMMLWFLSVLSVPVSAIAAIAWLFIVLRRLCSKI